jgi:hypothetical protein
MRARLSGGHFRMLNEKLYTCRFAFYTSHFFLVYFYIDWTEFAYDNC